MLQPPMGVPPPHFMTAQKFEDPILILIPWSTILSFHSPSSMVIDFSHLCTQYVTRVDIFMVLGHISTSPIDHVIVIWSDSCGPLAWDEWKSQKVSVAALLDILYILAPHGYKSSLRANNQLLYPFTGRITSVQNVAAVGYQLHSKWEKKLIVFTWTICNKRNVN